MTLLTGLDHVLIEAPADCEAAARHFFGDILGLPELSKPPALAARGGCWFGLPDGRQLHIGVTPDFQPRKKGHPGLRCQQLDQISAHLSRHGIPHQADAEAGVARIFLDDPWGNRLEIVEGQHPSKPT
ncbi:Glyoxalase/bleomycin resistance protein/dioxygenase [Deinococcus proteolyticus MRP]|uniref:Glyoxalase/bleomycin resistance protein/dioxygenase n=1 Tax=Deinococcus proteolyticus (strain ATCC 35074 / DSM 20540 / JCM 6276 / NBRC 101906 / NCIMB 13154 / VKM Ac-1939 / CCM 2703 / MRP) TaxID=693977 RepID=F0RP82_DEIPM|nr:glyoxalase [Deinococcus proteolyticus]ADY26425.1 Glyoxalase/bleomycin resistance protein/dioxygenase [Deinococcus proteolyticus MRP]